MGKEVLSFELEANKNAGTSEEVSRLKTDVFGTPAFSLHAMKQLFLAVATQRRSRDLR